jgi:serine/threonine protein kinase/tetratricopeptide (TPR) repeat protein
MEPLVHAGLQLVSEPPPAEQPSRDHALPRAGEEFMGFRLVRELGRGAFARVFLAEQLALAGRRVAVKISRARSDESQTLAQLQHTHIVPIYSAHVDRAAGLRMVVMPYFGGTTLDRLLQRAGAKFDPRATGRSLITALDGRGPIDLATPDGSVAGSVSPGEASRVSRMPSVRDSLAANPWLPSRLLGRAFLGTWRGNGPPTATIGQPARHLLERSTYIQAVVWIAARLAEALAHAHGRGILHRDIKPSNVLIAGDGQPMLLDFNLARDLKTDDSGPAAYIGGTLPYMAPEHLDAFNSSNPTPASAVDERSDIYSLGVILFEMLTGKHPFRLERPGIVTPALLDHMAAERRRPAQSPRDSNPTVPRSLAAIVRRCLEPAPERRYQQASQLAEDLGRELDNLPLRHTREPSVRERIGKWVRRHPRWASGGPVAAIGAATLAALTTLMLLVGGRLAGYDAERRWLEFQQGLVRAQCLVHTGSEPGQNLAEGQKVCEQTLTLFDALGDENWEQSSRVTRLAPSQQNKLPGDVAELLMLLARVRVQQAQQAGSAKAQAELIQDAVRLLERAERCEQSSPPRALYEDRSNCRRLLGDAEGADADSRTAESTPVHTARDHYLLATSLAVEKQHDRAIQHLETALRLNPKHFWSHFELGTCYDQLGRYAEAVGAYRAAVALWPELPWTYLNRGLAHSRLGQWDDAVEDYSQAIRLDAQFGDAYSNRGLARLKQHQYRDALLDLDRALELGRRGGAVWAARGTARAGLGDWPAARSDFEQALRENPGDESILLSRGFALARQDADQALADFDRVLAKRPDSAPAHYGRAVVLAERSECRREAIEAAQRALACDPSLVPARAALAVLLARAGEFEPAVREAEIALEQSRAQANTGPVCYAAACTYALASGRNPQHAARACALLDRALQQNYGRESLRTDPDLELIRERISTGASPVER